MTSIVDQIITEHGYWILSPFSGTQCCCGQPIDAPPVGDNSHPGQYIYVDKAWRDVNGAHRRHVAEATERATRERAADRLDAYSTDWADHPQLGGSEAGRHMYAHAAAIVRGGA